MTLQDLGISIKVQSSQIAFFPNLQELELGNRIKVGLQNFMLLLLYSLEHAVFRHLAWFTCL